MANYTKLKVIWKNNLSNIYKENTIIGVGQEAVINIDQRSIDVIYVNFLINGESFTDLVEINKNTINVPFKEYALKVGTHKLEIVAYLKNGDIVPSDTFSYYIENALTNPNIVQSETNYPILMELLESVGEWNDKVLDKEVVRLANEQTRVENETKRIEDENKRISGETERIIAEEIRKTNEEARINAENSRLSKETERVSKEQARVSNENVRVNAENSRLSKETERINAETTRASN
jgi:hypothetical protein